MHVAGALGPCTVWVFIGGYNACDREYLSNEPMEYLVGTYLLFRPETKRPFPREQCGVITRDKEIDITRLSSSYSR
jgi:hypothetical protein